MKNKKFEEKQKKHKELKKMVLKRTKVLLTQNFPAELLDLEMETAEHVNFLANRFYMMLKAYVFQRKIKQAKSKYTKERYEIPANWIQAFKERWFPQWLLRFFPVKYEKKPKKIICEMNFYNNCPHLLYKCSEGSHLEFMYDDEWVHELKEDISEFKKEL